MFESKKELLKLIISAIVAALSAIVTSLGVGILLRISI